jgi:hypothetical protein
MISAWAAGQRLVLGQLAVGAKEMSTGSRRPSPMKLMLACSRVVGTEVG